MRSVLLALTTVATFVLSGSMMAQQAGQAGQSGAAPKPRPQDTEVWEPVPAVVAPGPTDSAPPADAIVLFDGRNLDEWVAGRDGAAAGWTVANGIVTVDKKAGNIRTKRQFKSYQLHIEWRIPASIAGENQARGNSGVFLASIGSGDGGYELQVLDSFNNKTYVNGQAGSVYKQFPPLVNASRKPGDWQAYDVVWTAPSFNADGSVKTPAFLTVLHNGVLIQNHVELQGQTLYTGKPFYKAYDTAPIMLQSHNDPSEPISFRNIWLRELR